MPEIVEWAKSHKPIVAGVGAAGVLGILLLSRKKAAATTQTLQPSLLTAGPSGFTAGIDPSTGLPWGYVTPPGYIPGSGGSGGTIIGGSDNPPSQAPAPAQSHATTDAQPAGGGFTSSVNPVALATMGILPSGEADYSQLVPGTSYQGGTIVEQGVNGFEVVGPTTTGSQAYSVATNAHGSGAVIPQGQRIAGEVYTPSGQRVF